MRASELSEVEKAEIVRHGLTLEDVDQQLGFYENPPAFADLDRPCTPGDGIVALNNSEQTRLAEMFDTRMHDLDVVKFVPASGAASRMFKTTIAFMHSELPVSRSDVAARAEAGGRDAAELLRTIDGLERYAFFPELNAVMQADGHDARALAARGDIRIILEYLLTDRGLDYAALPKALLRFHAYDTRNRTAFEEHLVEASVYARGRGNVCRLHFTVSPEHREGFDRLVADAVPYYEQQYGVRYEISFSVQKPSTDALAVDLDLHPFRDLNGNLLFRPGGHGALIENLGEIDADIVFVKNIDNVVPDHAKAASYLWKRALGGLAVELRARAFAYLEAVRGGSAEAAESAERFLSRELYTEIPDDVRSGGDAAVAEFIAHMLDRPLRLCGMVPNTGEPGGGPFWVHAQGRSSVQVVETSQIDPDSEAQQAVLGAATHFNPVDLVCAFRRPDGSLYDLTDYLDPATVFIAAKSKDGKSLLSLERPGLWNGAMANWNTVFVEVPLATFAPVKTMDVLLEAAHQPAV